MAKKWLLCTMTILAAVHKEYNWAVGAQLHASGNGPRQKYVTKN